MTSTYPHSPKTDSEQIPTLPPRTPSFDGTINSTPLFSSPDTPYEENTRPARLGNRLRMNLDLEHPPDLHPSVTKGGLGEDEQMEQDEAKRKENLGIGSSRGFGISTSPLQIPPEMLGDDAGAFYPDHEDMDQVGEEEEVEQSDKVLKHLREMDQTRIGDGWAQRDELRRIVRFIYLSAQFPHHFSSLTDFLLTLGSNPLGYVSV